MDGRHTYLTVLLFVSEEEKQFPRVRAYVFRWAKKKISLQYEYAFLQCSLFRVLNLLGNSRIVSLAATPIPNWSSRNRLSSLIPHPRGFPCRLASALARTTFILTHHHFPVLSVVVRAPVRRWMQLYFCKKHICTSVIYHPWASYIQLRENISPLGKRKSLLNKTLSHPNSMNLMNDASIHKIYIFNSCIISLPTIQNLGYQGCPVDNRNSWRGAKEMMYPNHSSTNMNLYQKYKIRKSVHITLCFGTKENAQVTTSC